MQLSVEGILRVLLSNALYYAYCTAKTTQQTRGT